MVCEGLGVPAMAASALLKQSPTAAVYAMEVSPLLWDCSIAALGIHIKAIDGYGIFNNALRSKFIKNKSIGYRNFRQIVKIILLIYSGI